MPLNIDLESSLDNIRLEGIEEKAGEVKSLKYYITNNESLH
jgi:hypothetical protein